MIIDDMTPSQDLAMEEVGAASDDMAAQDELRTWRPSRHPLHRLGEAETQPGGSIVQVPEDLGLLGIVRKFGRRPFVRLILGLSLFILAAIVYDNTLDGGSWTIRAEKAKPAEHKGAKAIPLTPDK